MASAPNAPLRPLPANIELVTEYDAIVIRRRWRTPAAYALAVFAVLWNGFMVVWMSIAFAQGHWEMAAFGSLHAAVGFGIIYLVLAMFLNQTDIRVDAYNLSVRHYPIRWPGNATIPVVDIAQLYCKKKVTHGKNGTTVTYEVRCVDTSNKERKLVSGLPNADQAQYIEREVESTLGLKNETVEGEL